MTARGIILYGPPAAGKDAITAELERQPGATMLLFAKLKIGRGRTRGYRPATDETIARLRRRGEVVYENHRYGNAYVVDQPTLVDLARRGVVPVVHMGQLAGVRALRRHTALQWLAVLVWCARTSAEIRLQQRGSHDVEDRLRVWDETTVDLAGRSPHDFQLTLDTDELSPQASAASIVRHLRSRNAGHERRKA